MKKMDHNAYQKRIKHYTDSQLRFVIEDCKEVLRLQPWNPNASYYLDEICYCDAELAKRYRRG